MNDEVQTVLDEGKYESTDNIHTEQIMDIEESYIRVGHPQYIYYQPTIEKEDMLNVLKMEEKIPVTNSNLYFYNTSSTNIEGYLRITIESTSGNLDKKTIFDGEINIPAGEQLEIDDKYYYGIYTAELDLINEDRSLKKQWRTNRVNYYSSLYISDNMNLSTEGPIADIRDCRWDIFGNLK